MDGDGQYRKAVAAQFRSRALSSQPYVRACRAEEKTKDDMITLERALAESKKESSKEKEAENKQESKKGLPV